MTGERDWTGWVLEETERHDVMVHLGRPLGELEPAQQDALRVALGERYFNSLWSDDDKVAVNRLGAEQATKIAGMLRSAGFHIDVRPSYFARRAEGLCYIDDVSTLQYQLITEQMLAAGVPVTKKR